MIFTLYNISLTPVGLIQKIIVAERLMKEIVWNNYPNICQHPTTKYLREQQPSKHLVTSDEGCESKHCGPPLFPFLLLSVDFCLHATNANTIQISNPTTKTNYDLWRLCSAYLKIAPIVIEQQCIVKHLFSPNSRNVVTGLWLT